MNFLRRKGKYKIHPDIILLDLNLPKLDGLEILSEIKSDIELRRTPVVILASSTEVSDLFKSSDLNTNCFISKPVDPDNFINLIRSIKNFWLTVTKFPA